MHCVPGRAVNRELRVLMPLEPSSLGREWLLIRGNASVLHLNCSSQECRFHVLCAVLLSDLAVVWMGLLRVRGANVS